MDNFSTNLQPTVSTGVPAQATTNHIPYAYGVNGEWRMDETSHHKTITIATAASSLNSLPTPQGIELMVMHRMEIPSSRATVMVKKKGN